MGKPAAVCFICSICGVICGAILGNVGRQAVVSHTRAEYFAGDTQQPGGPAEVALAPAQGLADEARRIRTLTVRLPDARGLGPCTVAQGEARSVRASSAHETILEDVSLPPNRDLLLRWPHASTQ